MAKLHWTPWMALSELAQEAEHLVAEGGLAHDAGYAWQPVADVLETAADFRLTLELPGVAREDVHIEARGRALVVSGLRRFARRRTATCQCHRPVEWETGSGGP